MMEIFKEDGYKYYKPNSFESNIALYQKKIVKNGVKYFINIKEYDTVDIFKEFRYEIGITSETINDISVNLKFFGLNYDTICDKMDELEGRLLEAADILGVCSDD